uniref:BED-type domain-containing protein n=1 Tax=Chenopodium quinoa TaxID=63459 RepID=A0A803N0A9_CHEQI
MQTYQAIAKGKKSWEIHCGVIVTRLATKLGYINLLPLCTTVGSSGDIYLDLDQLRRSNFIMPTANPNAFRWLIRGAHHCFLPKPHFTSLTRQSPNVWRVLRDSGRVPGVDGDDVVEMGNEEVVQEEQQQQQPPVTQQTTADDLYPLFNRYGKVVDVFIPRDRRILSTAEVPWEFTCDGIEVYKASMELYYCSAVWVLTFKLSNMVSNLSLEDGMMILDEAFSRTRKIMEGHSNMCLPAVCPEDFFDNSRMLYERYQNGLEECIYSLRKKRSKVWRELIEGKNVQGERIATCVHCNSILSAHRDSGTSHLKRHLERCANRPLGLTFEEDSDEENFVFDMNELRKEILNFIVEGGHSFTIVEEQGFRRMMKRATPKFKPFGRATTNRDLLKAYVLERDKLKDLLSNVSGRICLTTDNWKSNHTRQHFICVTSHFVDDSWKLRKKILRFRALAPPYDGVSIANEICMFLCQWKLDDRILSITVDNATYNDAMISCLKRRLVPRGGLSCGETLFHVRCCAHIINLIVQKGLTCISGILDKIRSFIKLIIKSSHRSEEFYDCAEKIFHLDVKRKLNLDMHVRWNSTYKMLGTSLYFKDVFLHLRSSHASFQSYIPLEDEWEKAEKGPYDYLKEMVKPMLEKFDKYWSDYNLYLSCAAILDPRYKLKFVEYCFSKLYGSVEVSRRINLVLGTMKSMFEDYKLQYASSSPIVVAPSPPSTSGARSYFDDYDHFVGTSARSQVGKSQLEMYLDDDALDLNSQLDILEFWHQSSVRYLVVSKMARDLLTIPVSTVASESAFSIGGKTVSASRSSLKSKTIQALVCMQDWHRESNQVEVDSELEDEIIEVEEDDDADPFY